MDPLLYNICQSQDDPCCVSFCKHLPKFLLKLQSLNNILTFNCNKTSPIRHIPYSTERLQEHCIDLTLKHCNIAWKLRNVSAMLLQACGNVEMSALRNITM